MNKFISSINFVSDNWSILRDWVIILVLALLGWGLEPQLLYVFPAAYVGWRFTDRFSLRLGFSVIMSLETAIAIRLVLIGIKFVVSVIAGLIILPLKLISDLYMLIRINRRNYYHDIN
jgi:hypothetical protein